MVTVAVLGGLAVALFGMAVAGLLADRYLSEPDDLRADLLVSDANKWAVFALLCGYVLVVEGRPLSSMTGRSLDPLAFVAVVGGGVFLLFAANAVTTPVFDRLGVGGLDEGMTGLASLSVRHRLFVAGTAGVTEQVLFHGYAVERLLELTGSPLLAGGVSFAAFTASHAVGWERGAVARIAVPALLTTVVYLLVRDVVALACIHALNDAVGLLLAGSVEKADDADGAEAAADGTAR
ncbi:CPBP family intramembrane metalloprotease [Haloferax sp. Atlit-10N]|uniref:CAAX amino terminal protease family protein n=1 Tax=Haloferax prahovense (strain DSM 18310 / JCM 13924 / TL6) TaxID=1227461 RepID=M0GNM2_HALPT|nr:MULTISPECIES: CPBP family glutamic-type intramembrane protease [Haloferax]ELZ73785.1 CAAX amino terminal protease family protein [Haloferax prahovense DSM 18310]RDZ42785.1 CPBP family intramembrane metalloprotease [Haloferax sp. Atlit-19N]RDZ43220.1 CPBP family intramembrane metalloprotease [Haloferax sp. Atlit-16N]RDZ57794.1 CPBP family intramembrane metalloprotease [Haloferax sp. Atlit-10N]